MRIRYSEIFTSFQGEGEYTGFPSVWLRFFGCNLNCNGFGQKDPADPSTYTFPVIDFNKVKSIEELPVFDKGCDSAYSWSKEFKALVHDKSVSDVADEIIIKSKEELGAVNWRNCNTNTQMQLCLTGGEPMLWQKQIIELCKELTKKWGIIPQITIETNGTIKLKEEFKREIKNYCNNLHFSISPKLFYVSGEKNAVKYDTIISYISLSTSTAIKFVMNDDERAWNELKSHLKFLRKAYGSLWIMPVGATKEQQLDNTIAKIARRALKEGFRVSARLQCYVFGNGIGT